MGLAFRRRNRRWDDQPRDPVGIVLASEGRRDFSSASLVRTLDEARTRGLTSATVITVARIHGTGYGLPHPGLMPTKAELTERTTWVNGAARDLQRSGLSCDGQVASTRHAAKTIVNAARLRGASVIVIDRAEVHGWRRIVEGDLLDVVRRRAKRDGIDVADGTVAASS